MPRLDNLPIGPAGTSAPADVETLMGQGRRVRRPHHANVSTGQDVV